MKFVPYPNHWDINKWQRECPELTYKVVSTNELPNWLPTGLTNKFNSAVIAASGNTQTYVGIIMGFRVDHDNIDEHPYVVAFDKLNNQEYSGFIEHGNWDNRTTPISPEMESLMAASGVSVTFSFNRKPLSPNGTLEDLNNQGILNGYKKTVNTIEEKRKK